MTLNVKRGVDGLFYILDANDKVIGRPGFVTEREASEFAKLMVPVDVNKSLSGYTRVTNGKEQ